ncbi:uncharacterized protein LOC106170044 isoform X2 [Lingula anatina]|uniref:Uncharacterized protein LOC106154649 isoform X2 n=2 Tax=Lingula anatina TaxID=7574 RepID=A0A1S3J4L6_LINAN|nr:uncharacterized protein LOC106154649 isoform X2 [Lingula anatina]XP_013405223.1 uncharacterized protein LOC106170044 isoform X2 [Lingula anatina]|eukprot:XP_013384520.1 uncharacterized protein LOC106154649 isoform X2 [Lingula anatina]
MAILRKCMCWTVQDGAWVSAVWTLVTSIISFIMFFVDLADFAGKSWGLPQWPFAFDVDWRMHVWKGFLACDIVMLVANILLIMAAALVMHGLKKMTIDRAILACKWFCVIMALYEPVELGIVIYMFSWYGANIWRFVWQVWWFMFWLIRFFVNIVAALCIYSRAQELTYDLKYGSQDLNGYFPSTFEMGVKNPGYSYA